MLGIKVIYEAHGKRTKMSLEQVMHIAKVNVKTNLVKEIYEQVNLFLPEVKSFDDRYTVFWVSHSTPKEFKETGSRVQVRQISYFKADLYEKL